MTLSASAPLGHLLAGQAAEALGIETVLVAMAAGTGLVALGLVGVVLRVGASTPPGGRNASPSESSGL